MAEVLLFHHAQGLTAGCLAFADGLRAAGHVVHAPDLYEGRTFDDLTDGVAHAEQLGFGTVMERGRLAAEALPLQIHTMEGDELGDVDVARELVGATDSAELFLYPGDRHLFADSSLPSYDEGAATLLEQRVLAFLGDIP